MHIDPVKMDEAFKQWLEEYSEYVEYISSVFGISEYYLRNVFFWGMNPPPEQ